MSFCSHFFSRATDADVQALLLRRGGFFKPQFMCLPAPKTPIPYPHRRVLRHWGHCDRALFGAVGLRRWVVALGCAVPFLASARTTAANNSAVDDCSAQIAKIAGRGDAGRGPGFRGRRAHELWFEKATEPQQEGLNISHTSPSEEVAAKRRETGSG